MEEVAPRTAEAAEQAHDAGRGERLLAVGGLLGALGVVSCCCLLPLTLVGLGASGAWIGNLTVLAHYKPLVATGTAGLLGYGFYCAYWTSGSACGQGEACAQPRSKRLTRLGLWIGTALFVVGLLFDSHIEPLLLGS